MKRHQAQYDKLKRRVLLAPNNVVPGSGFGGTTNTLHVSSLSSSGKAPAAPSFASPSNNINVGAVVGSMDVNGVRSILF